MGRVSNRPDVRVVDEVVSTLRRGALVILPTDTVYGVAADPGTPGAEKRLSRAKRRSDDKPIPLLAADCRQVEAFPGRNWAPPAARWPRVTGRAR